MPVTDMTGSDWNSPYRLPQGWTPYPDGSVGPSSGLPDWLKQLIPSPGASVPNAPGGPGGGVGPGGAYMPGGGVMGRQAVTPGAPSMGFPAQGGPPTIDPSQFQGGGMPGFLGGGLNPAARAAAIAAGVMQPTPAGGPGAPTNSWMQRPSGVGGMPGPQVTNPMMQPGADGINPYAAAAAANPPQGGPYVGSGAPGMQTTPGPAPAGVGGPYVGGQGPTPIDRNNPLPWQPTGSSPGMTMANAPPGNPSDTPRPGGPGGPPLPPRRPKNLGMGQSPTAPVPPTSSNPRFGLYQPQVPGSGQGGPLSRSPIYTALNLFGRG
jgi:hypothetical protein